MIDAATRHISLSGGDWQLKGYIGEDWRWRDAHMPQTRDVHNWIAASVPGSVHHDLWQAGLIADPYRGQNTLLAEWVSARTWLYRKQFSVDSALSGRRVRLCFEGVDYEASFYLNGAALGSHRSMFAAAQFEVGHLLRYDGDNVLAVVLQPAPHEQPQVGRSSLVRTHKTRMNYWWDFCPRLVHLGLWDDVRLQVSGDVRIEDVFVRPRLSADLSEATLHVAVRLSAAGEQELGLEVAVDGVNHDAPPIRRQEAYAPGAASGERYLQLTVPRPALWWPNGYGEQHLYDLALTVRTEPGGALCDVRRVRFGIRRSEFAPNDGAPDGAMPYTLVVNGRRLYIKGWNWVPMDLLYGVEWPQKRERLLRLAQRAQVNVLRVWGGGLIEKEAFYELCDRLGILVWQEFIQSSSGIENAPPTDPQTIELMREEARQIIPRRRNHPSLLLWCGGNELQDEQGRPQDDAHPMLQALKREVEALDPDRHWLPTSPSGPRFGNTLQNIAEAPDELHDVHGPWRYEGLEAHYTLFNSGSSLLNSEFGVEGVTNRRTLNHVVPRTKQRPIRRANPYWQHLGAWWIWEDRWDDFWGGLMDRDTAQVVRATQFLQAEGLRYAVEANRRRKYGNSGSLPWQFNEPYPMAACTSAVDYYARPKPAYHAVARAYAPLLVSACFARLAWSGSEPFCARLWSAYSGAAPLAGLALRARLIDAAGQSLAQMEQPVGIAPDASQEHGLLTADLQASAHDVFFLDLALVGDGAVVARNCYPFVRGDTLAPLLALPEADLQMSVEAHGDRWRLIVTNASAYAAPGVWMDVARSVRRGGYAYFDDNFMHLLPGEQRELCVAWEQIAPGERALEVTALSGGERMIYA